MQHICYGWDVEIRDGARQGRLHGSPRLGRCSRLLRLDGWIDPHAGRFVRRGSPGDWSLGYGGDVAASVSQASVDAISTPFVELIEGATTEPDNHGVRAGKGLIEHLDVMPLLAQELASVPPVPIQRTSVPAGARPAPTARSESVARGDLERAAVDDEPRRAVGAMHECGWRTEWSPVATREPLAPARGSCER